MDTGAGTHQNADRGNQINTSPFFRRGVKPCVSKTPHRPDRDSVDVVNDAELLAIVLRHRASAIQSEALAAVAIRRAKG